MEKARSGEVGEEDLSVARRFAPNFLRQIANGKVDRISGFVSELR